MAQKSLESGLCSFSHFSTRNGWLKFTLRLQIITQPILLFTHLSVFQFIYLGQKFAFPSKLGSSLRIFVVFCHFPFFGWGALLRKKY